jgi:hypothetical protein
MENRAAVEIPNIALHAKTLNLTRMPKGGNAPWRASRRKPVLEGPAQTGRRSSISRFMPDWLAW